MEGRSPACGKRESSKDSQHYSSPVLQAHFCPPEGSKISSVISHLPVVALETHKKPSFDEL